MVLMVINTGKGYLKWNKPLKSDDYEQSNTEYLSVLLTSLNTECNTSVKLRKL